MHKASPFIIALFLMLTSLSGVAQQVADTLYNPLILNPAYEHGQGSVVLIDEAHSNFHTLGGRFKAFAKFLRKMVTL